MITAHTDAVAARSAACTRDSTEAAGRVEGNLEGAPRPPERVVDEIDAPRPELRARSGWDVERGAVRGFA